MGLVASPLYKVRSFLLIQVAPFSFYSLFFRFISAFNRIAAARTAAAKASDPA
jgi:hypothetical protein